MERRWFDLLMDDHSMTEKVLDALERALQASEVPGADTGREPGGAYLGTMEVVQDLSPIGALQGERRLLSLA